MGYAEDKFFDYLRGNLHLLNCISVKEMLNQLRGTFTIATGEQLDRYLDRDGNTNAVFNFLNDLRRRDDWVNHFLRALWNCEHHELYYNLRDVYRSFTPKRVWEPPPPPYPTNSLPPIPYDNPQLDSLRGYASLPIQLNPNSPEFQPGPPEAPSPSRVQPQESRDLSTQPRAPVSQSLPSAQALPHAAVLPDEVDTRTSADGISKTPVAETSPFPPFVQSNGVLSEATKTPERYPSIGSSLPAREDITRTQPVQEKSENPEVVHFVEQRTYMVNTQRKDAINDLPHTPVIREVIGSDASSPSSSPSKSMGEVNKAWLPPQQSEVPKYSQVTSNPPPGQHTANAFSQPRPVESVPNPVTSAPSQRPSVSNSESGANAGAGPHHRQQPTYESSVHPSSCRPTNVDKPGVLNSVAGFADVTRETEEVSPLSRVPELAISDDESSNGGSHCSSSSKSHAARASKGSPTPGHVLTTSSTPRNASSGSVPKKRPELAEDPRRASSSAHSGEPNRQVPEENSFELSNDLSYYRLQFNEDPSVDLMAENRTPEQRTRRTSGTMETSDSKAHQEKEKPTERNLQDPLVIALSAAVVCLSLYIVWLKYKN